MFSIFEEKRSNYIISYIYKEKVGFDSLIWKNIEKRVMLVHDQQWSIRLASIRLDDQWICIKECPNGFFEHTLSKIKSYKKNLSKRFVAKMTTFLPFGE